MTLSDESQPASSSQPATSRPAPSQPATSRPAPSQPATSRPAPREPAASWVFDCDLANLLAGLGVDCGATDDQDAVLAAELDALEHATTPPVLVPGRGAELLATGPGLAAWLAAAPPGECADADLPGIASAFRRVAAWAQAGELAAIAEVAARTAARTGRADDTGQPLQVQPEAAAQTALALTMSQPTAEDWTGLAIRLRWQLPATAAALASGHIDLARARLISEATAPLPDETARAVEDQVLSAAGEWTTGQLRAALRRAVITADPDGANRRREHAERRARVSFYADADGTATLTGSGLPAVRAAAAMARITALARAMKAAGMSGGLDYLRAYVMIGLLTGTLPVSPPAPSNPPDDPLPPPLNDPPPDRPSPSDSAMDDQPPSDDEQRPARPQRPAGPLDYPAPPDDEHPPGHPPRSAGPLDDPVPPRNEQPPDRTPPSDDPRYPSDDQSPEDPRREDAQLADRPMPTGLVPGGGPERGPAPPGHVAATKLATDPLADPPPTGREPADQQSGPAPPSPGEPSDTYLPAYEDDDVDDPAYEDDDVDDALDQADGAPVWPPLPHALPVPPWASPREGLPPGLLDLLLPWSALVGTSAEPAVLARFGPISREQAATLIELAAADSSAEWRIILTDDHGHAQAVDRLRAVGPLPAGLSRAGQPVAHVIGRVTVTIPESVAVAEAALARESPATRWAATGSRAVTASAALGASPAVTASRAIGASPALGASPAIGASPAYVRLCTSLLRVAGRAAERAQADRVENQAVGNCAHRQATAGYRPASRLRELVIARDHTCTFPPCRQPARETDLDHTIPWHAGGPTCHCNLASGCRTHHQIKQLPGWKVEQRAPGTLRWTTPAGRAYTVEPYRYPI